METNSFNSSYDFIISSISDIKSFKTFSKMKTIINILFNLFSVLYFFQRIKNNDKDCQIGILIDLIVISESIVVIVLGSIDVENFSELFNDSKYECLKDAKNNFNGHFI